MPRIFMGYLWSVPLRQANPGSDLPGPDLSFRRGQRTKTSQPNHYPSQSILPFPPEGYNSDPDLTTDYHESQFQNCWKKQHYLQGLETCWISIVSFTLYCLDMKQDLFSFLKLGHEKQMSRSPGVRNKKWIEIRQKHSLSWRCITHTWEQPLFSTFIESAKTYFKKLSFCRSFSPTNFAQSVWTQRPGETERCHIEPQSMPILLYENPTTVLVLKQKRVRSMLCFHLKPLKPVHLKFSWMLSAELHLFISLIAKFFYFYIQICFLSPSKLTSFAQFCICAILNYMMNMSKKPSYYLVLPSVMQVKIDCRSLLNLTSFISTCVLIC